MSDVSDVSDRKPSLYWVLIGPAIALALAGLRFAIQGSFGLYTEPDKQFYLPDPDLGLRLSNDTHHWLGLDRTGVIVAIGGFLLVATFLLLRRERKKSVEMKKSRLALAALSPIAIVIPLLAFLGGTPPEGAVANASEQSQVDHEGFAGSLGGPAGTYKAIEHAGSFVAAPLKAGGDSFEAKFPSGVRGSWSGDPSDLSKPMSGTIYVSAKGVKTGDDLRNDHTRGYLKVEEFPEISFRLNRISGTSATDIPNKVGFSGEGAITILGREIATPVTGTVAALDSAGKKRLGLGDAPALVVNASMSLRISETPIDAGDAFEGNDEAPINVSLVLTYEGES